MSYVTDAYRGQLSTLNGQSLTVALMDPSFVGGPDDGGLSAVSGEIVAAGYARQTVTGVWEPGDGVLTWDAPPNFDADGAPEIQTALVADDTGQIVAGLTWSEPIAGVDGLELDAPYIASVADEAGVLGRLDDLDTRVAVLESAPPGGGGGQVDEIVAGTNITVNNADPTRPIISATGGGSGPVDAGGGVQASTDGTVLVLTGVVLFSAPSGPPTQVAVLPVAMRPDGNRSLTQRAQNLDAGVVEDAVVIVDADTGGILVGALDASPGDDMALPLSAVFHLADPGGTP